MSANSSPSRKAYKGPAMEGMVATWYAKHTASQAADFAAEARRIADRVPNGARVLEVAPGPGYLAVALARLGPYVITGLDISESFVRIARVNAARAGVAVEFRQGDAARTPFADDSFDFIVTRAAFKNFSDPVRAIGEMYRVLKPGGEAQIIDMRRDVSDAELDRSVDGMGLNGFDAFVTRMIFKHSLRKRAYAAADFQAMAAATPFGGAEIQAESIGVNVWLRKPAAAAAKQAA